MRRVFIKDVGRFKVGDERDYSKAVWDRIAHSADRRLNQITKPSDEVVKGLVAQQKRA